MSLQHERLANEREHSSTALQLTVMIALTLAVVVGVNAWAIAKSPPSARKYDGLIVDTKWELASKGAPAGGVVVVGDSGGNFGVDGSVLAESLGVPVVNLCTYGRFLMTGARWMLEQSVESAQERESQSSADPSSPSLALVMIGSQTLVKEPDGFTFAEMPVSVSVAASGGLSPTEVAQVTVSRLFPLFTQSVTFAKVVRGEDLHFDPVNLPIAADGTATILSHYPDGIPSMVDTKVVPEIRAFEGPIPRVTDRAAIERMIQGADRGGYDIVFVDGPVWEGLVGYSEQVELMRQFHEYLDAICATSERAFHLPGPQQTFPKEDMENPFHLMPPAAKRFTAELGERLKEIGLPRSN